MSLPDGYSEQNGCHNCTHVFVVCGVPPAYFCNKDKPQLPERAFKWRAALTSFNPGRVAFKRRAIWLEWARARKVSCGGKCKKWRKSGKRRTVVHAS